MYYYAADNQPYFNSTIWLFTSMIILYVTSWYFNHPVTFSGMLNVITPTDLNGTMCVRMNKKFFKIQKFNNQKRIKILV